MPCVYHPYTIHTTSIPRTLQDVNLPMGPIAVHPASPAALARRLDWVDLEAQAARVRAAAAFGKTFSADGEADAGAQFVPEAAESGPSLCEIGVGAPVAIVQAYAYARARAMLACYLRACVPCSCHTTSAVAFAFETFAMLAGSTSQGHMPHATCTCTCMHMTCTCPTCADGGRRAAARLAHLPLRHCQQERLRARAAERDLP
mgnify:CR=1 FL=1